ncbi:tripartite tricarboxylate transporter TctB family protein [Acuticoccus kandeliae]|uniref:tripartite tricarboxylate transporter TctB family protein n=1 Tax=Acuticoccus kandeliae TaxID=2073160 RepID=UPI00130071F6|nr:tripartite tricarboxylate transporter TctB family protein [Acuticoccus kandeliae]
MQYVIALGAAAFGALYLAATYNLPELRIEEVVGPKVFPAIIGVGILVSAALIAWEAWAKGRAGDGVGATEGEAVLPPPVEHDPHALKRPLTIAALVAFTVLYITLLEPVGYLILTPIFIFAIASFFNRGGHLANLLVAVGFGVGVYFVFNDFLGVRLPLGVMAG